MPISDFAVWKGERGRTRLSAFSLTLTRSPFHPLERPSKPSQPCRESLLLSPARSPACPDPEALCTCLAGLPHSPTRTQLAQVRLFCQGPPLGTRLAALCPQRRRWQGRPPRPEPERRRHRRRVPHSHHPRQEGRPQGHVPGGAPQGRL